VRLAATAIVLSLASPIDVGAQGCGPPGEIRKRESISEVRLLPLPTGPSYYYRADDFVVFIRQEAVQAYFEKLHVGEGAEANRVATAVLSDLPLRHHVDLFSYNLRDWAFENGINFAVVQLIAEGNAAIANLGGADMEKAIITHVEGPGIAYTEVRVPDNSGSPILSRLECIDD
jgi:hypothetical protein